MNEYIFHTSEGSTLSPTNNTDVENCQVLGCAFGITEEDARTALLDENPWIDECGFCMDKVFCKQILTDDIKRDILKVVLFIKNNSHLLPKGQRLYNEQVILTLKRLSEDTI